MLLKNETFSSSACPTKLVAERTDYASPESSQTCSNLSKLKEDNHGIDGKKHTNIWTR